MAENKADAMSGVSVARIQESHDQFCKLCNIYGIIYSLDGEMVTKLSCPEGEQEKLEKLIDFYALKQLACGVHESGLEELRVEDTEFPWLKIGICDVKGFSGTDYVFCYPCVLSDYEEGNEAETQYGLTRKIKSSVFYNVLDYVMAMEHLVLENHQAWDSVTKQNREYHLAEVEREETLRRLETTTEIIRLLGKDINVTIIMEEYLKLNCCYLGITCGQIFKVPERGRGAIKMVAWKSDTTTEGSFPDDEMMTGLLNTAMETGVLALSRGQGLDRRFEDLGIRAMACIPICFFDGIRMYACFYETQKDRVWTKEEILFLSDEIRVLQSIVIDQIRKESLKSSYESLEETLNLVASGVYVEQAETGRMLFANQYFLHHFKDELKSGIVTDLFSENIAEGKDNGSLEWHYFERDRWYDFFYGKMKWWVDGSDAIVYSVYDVTDKKKYQHEIEKQAYTDFLTGLYNRMCCERDLAKFVDDASQHGQRGALLYLDLDDFKHVNDGLGHQYGDILLQSISSSVRKITGITDTCYRMGGDEFVIVIPPEYYESCDRIIDQIKEIFNRPWFLKDADYYCTMSMGVVTFPDDGESVEDLIKKADISMYDAKKSGKNRVAKYTGRSSQESNKRLSLEKSMRSATVRGCGEFEVYYQPIVDITEEGMPCIGAEALVRWNSSELGFVSPAEFIPLAEYLGLINPIGNHILREACKTCKRWNDSGKADFKINVNLSVVQLLQPDIVVIVKEALEESGLRPENLTVEVTESLAINDMRRMQDILGNIRKLGVKIALDDFGTGYSSLGHIREMPLDIIKVDQSFVKDLAEDEYSQAFIRMIGSLASTIGVKVCVEGIETTEQYAILENNGVSMVQGYFFNPPMKEVVFEKTYVI